MSKTNTSKKRANGQGSLFYNTTKKLWVGQYVVEGKRKTLYGKTKTEVQQRLIKAQGAVLSGQYFDPSLITVKQWLDTWFKEYMIGKRAPKTVEGHANNINNHILPAIGDIKLKDIKGYTLQKLYNELERKYSARTVQLVHTTLNTAFKQAIRNDLIQMNAASKCVLPKHIQKKSRALSLKEQKKFVEAIKGTQYELVFLLCLYAGLRRGEVLALQWKDIDFDSMQININKTVARVKVFSHENPDGKGQKVVKDPKSKTSNRVIPLAENLVPIIKEQRKKMLELKLSYGPGFNTEDFLFTDLSGNVLDGNRVSKHFKRLSDEVLDEPATVHSLRHTFATRGAESGVSMKVMQELCGHSKIDITADIYTHISSEYKKQEFSKMSVIL